MVAVHQLCEDQMPDIPHVTAGRAVGEHRPPVPLSPAPPTLEDLVGPTWAKTFRIAVEEATRVLSTVLPEASIEVANEADDIAEDLVMAAITALAQEIVARKNESMRPVYNILTYPPVYDLVSGAFDSYVPGKGSIPFLDEIFKRSNLIHLADAVRMLLEADEDKYEYREEGTEYKDPEYKGKEYIGPGLRMLARTILEHMHFPRASDPHVNAHKLWRALSLGVPAPSFEFYRVDRNFYEGDEDPVRDVKGALNKFYRSVGRYEARRYMGDTRPDERIGKPA